MCFDILLVWFGLSIMLLELVFFVLVVIMVWFNICQNYWVWLFLIFFLLLYVVVFVDVCFYGDVGLQFVFVVVLVWGWMQWLCGGDQYQVLQVLQLVVCGWVIMVVVWLGGWLLLFWFLQCYIDIDVLYMDGFFMVGSLVGQFLLFWKKLENWLVWIVVDVFYVGLYFYKYLIFIVILYVLFVLMVMVGWCSWQCMLVDMWC